MNKQQAQIRAKYATACNMARIEGKPKPNWEQWKNIYDYNNIVEIPPNMPGRTSTTQRIKDNARRQEKALKQINITIKNVIQQADIIDDFFQELAERHPEYKTYHKLSDYIFGSILDIQEKLQTL